MRSGRIRVSHEIYQILQDPVEVRALQQEMAEALLRMVRENYEAKSAGGIGSDKTRWKPIKASHPIMKDTERLYNSLEVKEQPDGSFGVHFRIFPPTTDEDTGRLIALQERPAWPDEMPDNWLTELTAIVARFLKVAIHRRLVFATTD
jgi:hypothetical protein